MSKQFIVLGHPFKQKKAMDNVVHIVCPSCSTINRFPVARLSDRPQCGKCAQSLFQGNPAELTSANFQRHLTRNNIPLLIDFWAPWCGPCKMMGPAFKNAAAQLEPLMRLAKVNTESEPAIGSQFAIRSIPTLVLFQNGQEVSRKSGAMSTEAIVAWAQREKTKLT